MHSTWYVLFVVFIFLFLFYLPRRTENRKQEMLFSKSPMINRKYGKAGIALRLALILGMLVLAGCSKSKPENDEAGSVDSVETETPIQADTLQNETVTEVQKEENAMTLYIDDMPVDVSWDENMTVEELSNQAAARDITVDMSMYGGWEQVGSLGRSYSRNDTYITAECGDIVLYSGNQIVVFYGSNSWDYTHLGRMNLSDDEVKKLLGNGDVTLKLSAK